MTTSIPPGSIDDRADVVITSPTNGQVLKYNGTNWVNAAESGGGGSGDLVLISTATASNSSSIDFTGLDSTYSSYIVIATDIVPSVDDAGLYLRTSTNNGSSFDTTSYGWRSNTAISTTTTAGTSSDSQIEMTSTIATGGMGNTAGEVSNLRLTVFNPSAVAKTLVDFHTSCSSPYGSVTNCMGSGSRDVSESVDAIRLFTSSGNITSGTFKLYGIT